MSNSPLVNFTRISPNRTSPRNHVIDTITIHCVVGQLTVESLGAGFATAERKASSNYGIGKDGRIGMYVEEKDRSWCSSSRDNDNRAITIEVASDSKYPYAVNDAAYKSLINLLVDICKRNNIKKLLWKNDKSLIGQVSKQNMTVHRWFANTECPGEYLYSRYGQIADDVNTRLAMGDSSVDDAKPEEISGYTKIVGDSVATAEQMIARLKKVSPNVPKTVIDMIPYYISEGKVEGIRGDIAFAQSCIETGNFLFPNCNVTLDQNNFCGMGVVADDSKGNSFETPQLGIRAQIQHLKAYASTESLVNECVDPRFKYVTRGSAEYVEWLGIQENPNGKGWAAAKDYGSKILRVLDEVIGIKTSTEETKEEPVKEAEPDVKKLPYTVKVTIPDLVIRKGPGISYEKRGAVTGKGVFTIVEEKDGWGKLKSGIGWIPLTLVNPEEKKETEFLVKVSIPNLNIRKGPGSNFEKTGRFTGVGVFTIVDVQNGVGSNSGWGKLKSGVGWISLDYTTKA